MSPLWRDELAIYLAPPLLSRKNPDTGQVVLWCLGGTLGLVGESGGPARPAASVRG